ncbi:hypothetical protein DXG01_005356, partial [Tephrocybe rancida]
MALPETRKEFIDTIGADSVCVLLLATDSKDDFADRAVAFAPAGLFLKLKGQAPETFMRTFLGWCQEAKPLVEHLHGAIVACRHKLEDIRAVKLAFIRDAGLHLSPAARDAALSLMRALVVKPLDVPYPPKGEIISENSAIHGKWSQRF